MGDELRLKRALLQDAEESARLYDGRLLIRGSWTMDGAATLVEAARRLRDRATELEWLAEAGWRLEAPVQGDVGKAVHPAIPVRNAPD